MAEIKPFRALRFADKAGAVSSLTCPPYDIISEEERRALLLENPYNVIRLELPREGEDPYAEAGQTLKSWISDGILRRDTDPGLYLYEEEFTAYGQTKKIKGIVCLVRLEEFSKGIILPHEETLSKAKQDRFNLMSATGCNFSQIYSLYNDESQTTRGRIDALSSGEPRYEFRDGAGVTHRMWLVNDPVAIRAVCEDFADRKLYIADGHHRYETALNYRNALRGQGEAAGGEDYVMMMLVDMENDGLVVFPTHRMVRGLTEFSAERLLSACKAYFDVIPRSPLGEISANLDALYRQGKKAFACYCGGEEWTLLILKDNSVMAELLPEKSEAYRGLDVSVLHSLILERLLGIDRENMANQKNLAYTRSMEEAVASVQKGESRCAFLLNPTRVREIRDVAAAGEKMPQKSTYFYPKLITGLVMNQIG
ncbi:DUF1015 domain-containing protein [Caproiciproducens sp. NJN-50]|uniref:DUF1015 domain-containing protein n=1 Tax=Acutalibacteraceae TaxID=3082771 RepID=UPI000FFE01AF|nr:MULTISPECIES: DUF1015 domain-containing protein [Acutalibacteraceae]QAT48296.1 DUF1015 domain-containing protein [Caproiciproducens sp. NJN-50]